MAKQSIAMATSAGGRDHSPRNRVNLCDPIIRLSRQSPAKPGALKPTPLILVSPSVTEAKQRQPVPFPSKETGGTRDADLVARCRAGDVDAFETIYNQHAARIYTLACRMAGSPQDGEDLLQEIFLQAHRKLASFKGDSALGTWLYRLALNHCLDYVRSRRAKMGRLTDTLDAEGAMEPVAARETPIARVDLERALQQLPEGCREAFVLHDVEGFDHKEVARLLGIAEGTSKSQVFKARSRLRGLLK
jgi:RNA polymerase sigma-70 factor, ECF subfamily